jgi:hypothetical protein
MRAGELIRRRKALGAAPGVLVLRVGETVLSVVMAGLVPAIHELSRKA